jgi:membrane protein DedA with SNARE-associated domain
MSLVSLPQLLSNYGYLTVFVGSLLDGETILLLAGFAARQGYLTLHWIVLPAICGGTIGDQVYFFLGRRYGGTLLLCAPGGRAQELRVP